ncbi:MAG: WYL domain-containing protein [Lachnospiraceae bacterium]|nr:WYL domain-containing protein [Lachnospiraceae bacterium]
MAKNSGQKLKLLYIVKILEEYTDENHPITTKELIEKLALYDVTAERKSIYDDVARLQEFGYDIIQKDNRSGGGYYLASRDFELVELKLLVDAVQSSRFVTEKKSRQLIGKLEKLINKYDSKQLHRQVYVAGRVKTDNEGIYYQVDAIQKAIAENKQIQFVYMEWNAKKELVPRKEEKYLVSPWILMWQEEKYYLVAYDHNSKALRHYRVDKLSDVDILDDIRLGQELYKDLNPVDYVNKAFGMFGAREEDVILTFPEQLVGVIIDRFGKEVSIRPQKEGLRVRVKVMTSTQFFAWVAGVGKELKIAGPEKVCQEYKEWLTDLLKE